IEPGVVITVATRIGERCRIKAHTVIESSELADDVVIGPAAHLRPGSRLGPGVRIGNYVEVKNSHLGAGVKADHLSYIGDADAVVGCNANLIAPVRVGERAYVAAGATVTGPVPEGALAVARERKRNVEGWSGRKRPAKPKPGSKQAKE